VKFLSHFCLTFSVIVFATAAHAGSFERWSNPSEWDAPSAEICSGKYGPCLRLSCAAAQPLHLETDSDTNELESVTRIDVQIDGELAATLSLDADFHLPALFDSSKLGSVISGLSSGKRAKMLFSNGKEYALSLSGSSAAISRTMKECNAQAIAFTGGLDTFSGTHNRYSDEGKTRFPPGQEQFEFKKYKGLDIYGGDIRSALDDGYLVNMTLNQCEALCSVTKDCLYYTHNAVANACFIKGSVPKTARYNAATSAEFNGNRYNLLSPVARGMGTLISKGAGWLESDTYDSWLKRRKALAAPLGVACHQTRASGEEVARKLKINWDSSASTAVGQVANVSWSGLELDERLPIWLMISSDKPVRFGGKTFIALGPDSPNPFGMAHGAGKHRALVALFSRGAGATGQLEITALQEGNLSIEAAVVQYLRACGEEIVRPLNTKNLHVSPGRAELVLNNEIGNRAFTHEIELEKYGRIIRLNEKRFVILDKDSGSEILLRAGSELAVSPTHRFLAVSTGNSDETTTGNSFEIVDVVDGATVAKVEGGGILYWGLHDSFAMSTKAPWGEVNIAELHGRGTFLEEQVTGPSCCFADAANTHVGIDLENTSFSVWGRFGYAVGSLQFPEYLLQDNPRSAYTADKYGSFALFQHIFNSLGSLTPVSMTLGFDIPGGWILGNDWQDTLEIKENGERLRRPFGDQLAIRLERVGLDASKLKMPPATTPALDIANQFSRLGISLVEMKYGEIVYDGKAPAIAEEITHDSNGNYVAGGKQRALTLAPLVSSLGVAAKNAGWKFDWSDNVEIPMATECYHVDLQQSEHNSKRLMLVRDIGWLARLDEGKKPFFLSQAWCTAGATYGSLRPTTAIYFYDFAGPVPKTSTDVPMETAFFYENDPSELWYDHPFSIKGNDKTVLLFAKGKGAAAIFSRVDHKVVQTFDNLPDGDLLSDLFVTDDLSHLVQVNSDGAVHVIRSADKKRLLSGRIVDNEIVLWADDYSFEATAEAAALIDLKFPGRQAQFSLDRFQSTRRVDKLALRILSGESLPVLSATGIPPELAGTISLDGRDVVAQLSNQEGDITEFSVFQDGVRTDTFGAEGKTQTARIKRLRGARWVSVIGVDDEGLASLPITKDLGLDPGEAPTQRALVVGVNTYNDPNVPSLNYALRDGGRFGETLAGGLGDAPDFEKIEFLKDRRATPAAILDTLRALLSDLGQEDQLVMFFAGHGIKDAEGNFYFATSETSLSDIKNTALPFKEVSALIEASEARITVLLDACHSGAVGTGAFATSDQAVSGLAGLKSNITILAASKGREFSQEKPEVGGGVFTYALEKVLKLEREHYDKNGNGRLEASEVYSGVKDIVTEIAPGTQTPWIVNSKLVGEYALF
jgi:hypothetical protein